MTFRESERKGGIKLVNGFHYCLKRAKLKNCQKNIILKQIFKVFDFLNKFVFHNFKSEVKNVNRLRRSI